MELVFKAPIPLSSNHNAHQVGHETNNTLVDYFSAGVVPRIRNQRTVPEMGQYDGIVFENENNRVPTQVYSNFGVKTFPQMGAYGFFKQKYTPFTDILIPINAKDKRYTPPTVVITIEGNNVIFTLTDPSDVSYECYRIVMRNGFFAEEYITYEKTFSVLKPFPDATYSMYVIGYRSDGKISYDSPWQDIVITGSIDPIPTPDIPSNLQTLLNSKFDDARIVVENGQNKLNFYGNNALVDSVVLPASEGGGGTSIPGGLTGQVLSKASNDDYDYTWIDMPNNPLDEEPIAPSIYDDDFTGTSLDAKWAWYNQGSSTAEVNNSFLTLKSSPGTDHYNVIAQSITANKFTITAKLTFTCAIQNYFCFGLAVLDSTDKCMLFGLSARASGHGMQICQLKGPTTWGSDRYQVMQFTEGKYFKFVVDNTAKTIDAYFSIEGANWLFVRQMSLSGGTDQLTTISRIGLGWFRNNTNTDELANFNRGIVDWFRVTIDEV